MTKKELILKLFAIKAIKFGNFKLKSGIRSPIYIDLRMTISYPKILKAVAEAMWESVKEIDFDVLCGVPYTALPIATAISLAQNKPMIMRRKEVKDYGTKKAIEGEFKRGDKCLVVEDLITSGASVFETVEPLQEQGLKVKDVVVLLDRQQGGQKSIVDKGLQLHAVIKMDELLQVLKEKGKISQGMHQKVTNFIKNNQL